MQHRSVRLWKLVGGHQVHAGEILVGGIDALEVFAGHIHEHRQARAVRDVNGVELLAQFRQGVSASDDDVALDLHAHFLQALDFLLHDFFRQPKLRDAVNQNAARFVQRFVNRHVMPAADQFAGRSQTGRPGADNCHAFAGGRGLMRG